MPYVQVWVDDCECDCDGDCKHATELRDGVNDALELLTSGDVQGATRRLKLLNGDKEAKRMAEHERELAALFAKWKAEPVAVPFLEWAHTRRKASLT